jgi:hypothetical protein
MHIKNKHPEKMEVRALEKTNKSGSLGENFPS